MSEQLEIEYKNLLSKEEYETLLEQFQISNIQINRQINHYFDTATFSLKDQHTALRVREKSNNFEMTIKQPASIGLLETNQKLEKKEAQRFLQGGSIPEGVVKNKLSTLAISVEDILYFGTLITDRVEIEYKGGILVFDHSHYLNMEDYEIEYEVIDPIMGEKIFTQLLASFHIPIRKTENKVHRFYQHKYQQSQEN